MTGLSESSDWDDIDEFLMGKDFQYWTALAEYSLILEIGFLASSGVPWVADSGLDSMLVKLLLLIW